MAKAVNTARDTGRGLAPLVAAATFAGGLVLGFVLGGVGPRNDLAERDAEIARLSADLAAADRGGFRSPVPGLDRVLRAPPGDPGAIAPNGNGGAVAEASGTGADDGGDEPSPERSSVVGDGGVRPIRPLGRRGPERGEDALDGFERAVSLQRVRNVQSRAALEQQAGLDDEELAEVDSVLDAMNDELVGYGEELLVMALDGEPPPARNLLGLSHDVTGILLRAQTRLEGVVGPERMPLVEPGAIEVWNHVALERLEPAARAAVRRAREASAR